MNTEEKKFKEELQHLWGEPPEAHSLEFQRIYLTYKKKKKKDKSFHYSFFIFSIIFLYFAIILKDSPVNSQEITSIDTIIIEEDFTNLLITQ